MRAEEAAKVAEEAALALRGVGQEAYAVLEDLGDGDYRPHVAIPTDTAYELAHQMEVERS